MQMNIVSGRTILIFKEPLELILTGLTEQIGKPKEYQKKEIQVSTEEIDLTIPLSETDQWKSLNKKSEENETDKDEKISQAVTESPQKSNCTITTEEVT